MTKQEIMALQKKLQAGGFYEGIVDGIWGSRTQAAFDASQRLAVGVRKASGIPETNHKYTLPLAWGKKVSEEFRTKVIAICKALGMPMDTGPSNLMSCMAWESGESFSPSIKNGAGSGATGLIQFMPKTAIGLGTTVDKLAAMTAEEQLEYVYKYFLPYKGKLKTLSDLYMAILYPVAVGKPDDYVLFVDGTIAYRQNKGLDLDLNQKITKAECSKKVTEKLKRGLTKAFVLPAAA